MSGEKLTAALADLKSNLWLLPALFTAAAISLAVLTVGLDMRVASRLPAGSLLFSGSAEGARGVLSTIAGSIITVTGVVFSITIVALQLASSQFTPRVLRSFTEDRANQVVLGIFIGTFTYAILVLRAVRAATDDNERFVPEISITIAVLLALTSIGALIFFVNHIAHSIQVETIIERVATDMRSRVDELFPEKLGEPATSIEWDEKEIQATFSAARTPVIATKSGYLQSVEEETILGTLAEIDLVLRMSRPIGTFVLEGDPLAFAGPAPPSAEVLERLRRCFHVGPERTLHHDLERGVIELTDIALRALSSGINDPTTAIGCIDRLTQILVLLGSRRFPEEVRTDPGGRPRVSVLRPEYAEFIRLAFAQLRDSAADNPMVAYRLVQSLVRVAESLSPERLPAVAVELRELLHMVVESVQSELDRDRILSIGKPGLAEIEGRIAASEQSAAS